MLIIPDDIDTANTNEKSHKRKGNYARSDSTKREYYYYYNHCSLHDLFIITNCTSIVNYIVPRLNDLDVDLLNKSLFYSKKAYEEAHAAKESSFRIESTLNDFIKEQLNRNQNENPNAGPSSNKTNKKQNFWYTVRCFRLTYFIRFIYFLIIYHLFQIYNRLL
jgi:hypothetical protein